MNPPNVFSEIISKALADHLGFAIFLGTIKGQNQLYKTYQAGTDDPAWFTVWQGVDGSLETETDATTTLLRQAVQDDRELIAKGLMTQEEFDQTADVTVVPEHHIIGSDLRRLLHHSLRTAENRATGAGRLFTGGSGAAISGVTVPEQAGTSP